MTPRDRFRLYGSIRILRDGRVRFSPWTFPVLTYLSFTRSNGSITVKIGSREVMELDVSRGRVISANFYYILTPDELRGTVTLLRRAGNGLERWIVPALEFTSLARTFQEDNPSAYVVALELLESCRDLPVAERWKRVRANVIANETATDTSAPARKPPRKTRKVARPRKRPTSPSSAR